MRSLSSRWLARLSFMLSLSHVLYGGEVRVTAIDPPKASAAATAMRGLFACVSFEEDIIGYRTWEDAKEKKAIGDKDRVITRGTALGVYLMKLPIPPDGLIFAHYLGRDEWYGANLYVGSKSAKINPSVAFMDLDRIRTFLKSNQVPESMLQDDLTSDQGLVNFAMKNLNERFGEVFGSVLGFHLLKNEKLPLVNVSVMDERTRPQDVSELVLGILSGDLK